MLRRGNLPDGSRECRLRLELLQHSLLLLLEELLLHLLPLKLLFLRHLLRLLHLVSVSLLLEGLGLALQFLHGSLMFQLEGALLLLQNARSQTALSASSWRRCSSTCSSASLGGVRLRNTVGEDPGTARRGVLIPVIAWSKPDPAPADWSGWPKWNGAEGAGGADGRGADGAGATSCQS